jgi:NAD(P)-dependent dehydrogenase (short-subunit alcohol dehydrogenase family)
MSKVALVTGGRSGIGLACAKRLMKEGYEVITAQRSPAKEFRSIEADFTDPKVPAQVIEQVLDYTGRQNPPAPENGQARRSGGSGRVARIGGCLLRNGTGIYRRWGPTGPVTPTQNDEPEIENLEPGSGYATPN